MMEACQELKFKWPAYAAEAQMEGQKRA